LTVETSVIVSPTDVNVLEVGASSIDEAACPTVISETAHTDPDSPNIVTEPPKEIAVTSPLDKTVATAGFAELHVTA
jgi:hypothetical protein